VTVEGNGASASPAFTLPESSPTTCNVHLGTLGEIRLPSQATLDARIFSLAVLMTGLVLVTLIIGSAGLESRQIWR
jgi:hypothetical protein